MGGFLYFGDYVFQFAYPIAFLGSMFYGVASIASFDPSSIILNRNITIFVNIIIGICGLISLFNWFQHRNVPIIGELLLPDGTGIIRTQE
jgi:hypothetical protein